MCYSAISHNYCEHYPRIWNFSNVIHNGQIGFILDEPDIVELANFSNIEELKTAFLAYMHAEHHSISAFLIYNNVLLKFCKYPLTKFVSILGKMLEV